MALPSETFFWQESIDPSDEVDFLLDLEGLLEEGENAVSYTLIPYPETTLLGVSLGSGGKATALLNNALGFWVSVSSSMQNDPVFASEVLAAWELTITTNNVPPRRKQRTIAIRIRQK